jgi:hypothetical protein
MNIKLKKLKDIISESCVTIILNTHRTKPDNEKDPLTLKNLIKDAEQRLYADEDKRDAKTLVERLQDLESKIDHRNNLESLILFVNEDIAEYTRLPIAVEDRVVIDHTFATRDLIRALHHETNYYVLVLSQQKVRLIEAFNDKVVAQTSPGKNIFFHSIPAVSTYLPFLCSYGVTMMCLLTQVNMPRIRFLFVRTVPYSYRDFSPASFSPNLTVGNLAAY